MINYIVDLLEKEKLFSFNNNDLFLFNKILIFSK